jgi:hypothetical protein
MAQKDTKDAFIRLLSRSHGNDAWLVHPSLRERLVESAEEQGFSLNDTAVAILAEKFGVQFDPLPRRTRPNPVGEELHLTIPWTVYAKIEAAAKTTAARTRRPFSSNDSIRLTLCAYYGLTIPPKTRAVRSAV